jgi:hypothetical protein
VDSQFYTEAVNYGGAMYPVGGANSALRVVASFDDTTRSGLMGQRKDNGVRLQLTVSGSPATDYNPEMVELLLNLKKKGPVATFKSAAQVLERFKLSSK